MLKFLLPLQDRFGFTRSEVKVVLLLVGGLLAGLLIRWIIPDRFAAVPPVDYSASDRLFASRSSAPASSAAQPSATRPALRTQSPAHHAIDLNTATKAELMLLPGIGPAYAERIILSREDQGPFERVEDLDRVKGIGPKTIERLRPFVVAGRREPKRVPRSLTRRPLFRILTALP